MQRKKAGELMKEKLPIEFNDAVITFSHDLHPGMRDRFEELLSILIPELYYTDRLNELDWLPGTEEPMVDTLMLMIYEIGISPLTGYFDGDQYRNIYHTAIPVPFKYKYIQLPL